MADGEEHTVGVTCPKCATEIVLMRPEILDVVGKTFGGPEAELAFLKQMAGDKALTGARLGVFGADRAYVCPECGERGEVPSEEELQRLKREQDSD